LTTARFSAVYSRFSFVLVDSATDGAFRFFVPDADGCVSVADVKDVGFVDADAEDDVDDPAEDADDEVEEASVSINSSNLTASGVEKSDNDFWTNLRAAERLPVARCF
jgi:hypothetical protein